MRWYASASAGADCCGPNASPRMSSVIDEVMKAKTGLGYFGIEVGGSSAQRRRQVVGVYRQLRGGHPFREPSVAGIERLDQGVAFAVRAPLLDRRGGWMSPSRADHRSPWWPCRTRC